MDEAHRQIQQERAEADQANGGALQTIKGLRDDVSRLTAELEAARVRSGIIHDSMIISPNKTLINMVINQSPRFVSRPYMSEVSADRWTARPGIKWG